MTSPRPTVTVVGLGPSTSSYLTEGARKALDAAKIVLVRTERHAAAVDLVAKGARPLDHHYEANESFEAVYRAIVDEVVGTAIASDGVVYAVPGSPFVLERTVELLREEPLIDLSIVSGMSFLDLAWERLGIDPVRSRVKLVDATTFSTDAAFEKGPLLVSQMYSRSVASNVKLSVEEGPSTPVVVLARLGHEDESAREIPWEELDRIDYDHLTCVYIPELGEPVGAELMAAVDVIATLRQQCPWDQEQTHESLSRHLLEETYEAIEAIEELGTEPDAVQIAHLEEELGDVFCQVLFHSVIASEEGYFSLADVARTLTEKLVHRHPHVFGDVTLANADAVVSQWEQIKQKEKGRESLMDGIPPALPALTFVTKIERKAKGVGLGAPKDGEGGEAVLKRLLSPESLDEETTGEILLTIARRSAACGVDPEAALRIAARRLRDRFVAAERAATEAGTPFADLSPEDRKKLFS